MERRRRPWLLAAALVGVAAWYLGITGGGPLERRPSPQQTDIVQTYLLDSRSLNYAEDGHLAHVMEAARVEHRGDDAVSDLEQPRFYSHDGNDQTWSASASRGRLKHRTSILILRKDVVLTDDQGGGVLETSAMTLNLKQRTARSKVPVRVTRGNTVLTADGMFADLKRQTIRLMPGVEGIYVPEGS